MGLPGELKQYKCVHGVFMQVLDDNREVFIPETQQLVKAHDQFLLFGTQNPPGSYGGRKVLV